MPTLRGIDDLVHKTGELYGQFAFGGLYDRLLQPDQVRANVLNHLQKDLELAGVSQSIEDMDVMDVGTGRQAIALAMAGAKTVSHFDISGDHVRKFEELLKSTYAPYSISTSQADLVITAPPRDSFDFVYLNGIVQHFSNTAVGLRNCADSVRMGGRIWVYFYRSGCFKWFACSMARKLLHARGTERGWYASILQFGLGDVDNEATFHVMDDLYVPYAHLYSPFSYIEFMSRLGFKPCGSQSLDPMADVNHDHTHHSSTIVFERISSTSPSADTGDLLTPEAEPDQLDPALYSDQRALDCLDLFAELSAAAADNPDPLLAWSTAIALHRVGGPHYYGEPELPPRYDDLRAILGTATKAYRNCRS